MMVITRETDVGILSAKEKGMNLQAKQSEIHLEAGGTPM